MRREFDGVADEVEHDLADAAGVSEEDLGGVGHPIEDEFDVGIGEFGGEEFADFDGGEVDIGGDGFDGELAGFDFREVEQVVDDGQEGFAGVADGFDELALVVVEGGIDEEVGKADDAIHGGADFVAHSGEEIGFGAGGGFGGVFRVAEGEFGGFAVGDVLEGSVEADEAAVGIKFGFSSADRPDVGAIGADHFEIEFVGGAVREGIVDGGAETEPAFRGVEELLPEVVGGGDAGVETGDAVEFGGPEDGVGFDLPPPTADAGHALGFAEFPFAGAESVGIAVLDGFEAAEGGDVALDGDVVGDLAVGSAEGGDTPGDGIGRAVFAVVDRFPVEICAGAQAIAKSLEDVRVGVRALEDAGRAAEDFGDRIAGHGGEGGIGVDDMGAGGDELRVGDDDGIVGVGEGKGEKACFLLGQALGGDVFGDHQDQRWRAGGVGGVGSYPAGAAIGVEITFFDLDGRLVAYEKRFESAFDGREIFGMDEIEAVALAELFQGVAGDLAVGGVGVDEVAEGIADGEPDAAAPDEGAEEVLEVSG
ncbi:MAG: hypothetical protein NTV52_22335, partial [Acidobacteria bacterium]|nr:hypothetical protein [Acidobacteriota bacterium]